MERFLNSQFFKKLNQNKVLVAIRGGMVMSIPWILAGSFALLLNNIPIPAYTDFITTFAGGIINRVLAVISNATLGSVSLILLLTISFAYGKAMDMRRGGFLPLVSLCGYIALTWNRYLGFDYKIFASNWLFIALCVTIISCLSFEYLSNVFAKKLNLQAKGDNVNLQNAIDSFLPVCIIILFFAILNMIFANLFGIENIQTIVGVSAQRFISGFGNGLGSGLIYVFMLQAMWFVGIHGGNVLDEVVSTVFVDGTGILSKTFFDAFVFFGGCGTILCLVLAILIGDKRRNVRYLTKLGLLPVVFNMNELFLFGIPIVLNPVYLIPFITVPFILTGVSYFAISLGFVPEIINPVNWTTPIFLSGYTATGSIAGSVLQLFLLLIGAAVYYPFVLLDQKIHYKNFESNIRMLEALVQEHEARGEYPVLIDNPSEIGNISRTLVSDLKSDLDNHRLRLFYQPQMLASGKMFGAEGLLRWKHPIGGYIYPPLVIALALQEGILPQLEEEVIDLAGQALPEILNVSDDQFLLSINLTANEICKDNLQDIIEKTAQKYHYNPGNLAFELTEQAAMSTGADAHDHLLKIRNAGSKLLMDDFGMGHSTALHLRSDIFDYVKLDGSLVKEVLNNERSAEIISSITQLSNSLGFGVIAEFVETEEQQKYLEQLGCTIYQGYFYSKPLPLEELLEYIHYNRVKVEKTSAFDDIDEISILENSHEG